MNGRHPRLAILLAAMACATMGSAADTSADAGALREATAAVISQLDPVAQSAAQRVPDAGRRLLAMRAYLRAGDGLVHRWSWTQEQATSFAHSEEGQALDRAVAAVRCSFEAANPGYTLFVNPEFRSLEIQLQRWNSNASVGRAAVHLQQELAEDAASGGAPGPDAAQWLHRWLTAHAPQPVPTLAAPGLSPHGRGSAIDFQVHRAGRVIAGPESATVNAIWKRGGWAEKLATAVTVSGAPFVGPLQTPDEPWHFRYAPGEAPARALADCAR